MLSRKASNILSRPRRSKSSSSVGTTEFSPLQPQPIDPETARRQAVAAASAAIGRASLLDISDNPSKERNVRYSHEGHQSGIARQRSIRFTGPLAMPKRQLTKHYNDRVVTSNQFTSPTPAHVYDTENPYTQGRTGTELHDTQAFLFNDAPCTPQDDVASAPSSYRRIRKSRSLLMPPEIPRRKYHMGTSVEGHKNPDLGGGVSRWRNRALRAPRSLSLLRIGEQQRDHHSVEPHPAAVAIAREQFLQQSEEESPQRRSSYALTQSARRNQKALRKTVRTVTDSRFGAAIASPNQNCQPTRQGLTVKARGFSAKIKGKLRRVFVRSGKTDSLPVQQLEASRSYWGRDIQPALSVRDGYDENLAFKVHRLSTISSRVPSIQAVSPNAEVESGAGSLHSGESDNDHGHDKSRVTSWTNSTATNTMLSGHVADFRRLSVIQEHANQSQVSLFSPSKSERYAAFRGPMVISGGAASDLEAIDSRRVYSALMKRLDETSPDSKSLKETLVSKVDFNNMHIECPSVLPRLGSLGRRSSVTTIRHLPKRNNYDLESSVGATLGQEYRSEGDVWSEFGSIRESGCHIANLLSGAASAVVYETASSNDAVGNHENNLDPRSITQPESGCISPSSTELITTPSQPERQLYVFEASTNMSVDHRTLQNPSVSDYRAGAGCVVPDQVSNPGSPSIYSKSDNSQNLGPHNSTTSLPGSNGNFADGLAEYLGAYDKSPAGNGVENRQINEALTIEDEWKTLTRSCVTSPSTKMAGKVRVQQLESSGDTHHRREHAQINDDEDMAIKATGISWRPLAGIHGRATSWRPERYQSGDRLIHVMDYIDAARGERDTDSLRSLSAAQQNARSARDDSSSPRAKCQKDHMERMNLVNMNNENCTPTGPSQLAELATFQIDAGAIKKSLETGVLEDRQRNGIRPGQTLQNTRSFADIGAQYKSKRASRPVEHSSDKTERPPNDIISPHRLVSNHGTTAFFDKRNRLLNKENIPGTRKLESTSDNGSAQHSYIRRETSVTTLDEDNVGPAFL